MGIYRQTFHSIAVLAAFVVAWFGLTQWTGWISPARFPSPAETLDALRLISLEGYSNGRLHQHVLQSILLVTLGFIVSSTFGVVTGILMGANKTIEAMVNPIFSLLRPIPPLAWIPLAIVWLGLENGSKILVIFVAAYVPSVINTFAGIRSLELPQREAAAMLGLSRRAYYVEVLIPAALPMIFTGMRLSLQASWTTLVASELVGAMRGLGSILNQAAQDIQPPMILVGMVSVAICGWVMTQGLGFIERRVMPWRSV